MVKSYGQGVDFYGLNRLYAVKEVVMKIFALFAFQPGDCGNGNILCIISAKDDWAALEKCHCSAIHPTTLKRDVVALISKRIPVLGEGWLQCRLGTKELSPKGAVHKLEKMGVIPHELGQRLLNDKELILVLVRVVPL